MRTGEKLISMLLILVMAVFLFTGCGKKDKGGDTSLEGTWRITKSIVIEKEFENGIEVHSELEERDYPFPFDNPFVQDRATAGELEERDYPFPFPMEDEESGFTMIIQPYYQLNKSNKLVQFLKVKMEIPDGIPDEVLDELRKEIPFWDDLTKGLFLKEEATYSVSGDKLIFTIQYLTEDGEEEEYTKEYTYVINGKKMVMKYKDIYEPSEDGNYFEEEEKIINLVKVSASEVASEKYYSESDFESVF